ncbi:MAG: hypothetical protein Q8O24_06125, partial [Gallionellaceae bacterium]|nr:hypothetical protein [Gallionellaceae bacterium]
GAQPPAVKGLRSPEFAETEEGVVEFSEWDDVDNANLWRRLREWFIGEKGIEVADQVIPAYEVKSLEQGAQDELRESQTAAVATPASAFSEQQTQGDEMSAEEKLEMARLKAENEKFKADQIAFAEADKKRKTDALHAGHLAFAEGLVKDGKLLPAHKDSTVATLDFMAGQEDVVEFGEGDAKKPLLDVHKEFLLAQPKQVEFAEVSGAAADAVGVVNFAAPSGYGVDSDRLALHNKALAYQSANKTTYEAALAAVSA